MARQKSIWAVAILAAVAAVGGGWLVLSVPSGPIRAEIVFPAHPANVVEPLVVTGTSGHADLFFVNYLGPGNLRFGYDSWLAGGPVSDWVPYEPGKTYILEVDMPSLRNDRNAFGELTVALNGKKVMGATVSTHYEAKTPLYIGSQPLGASIGSRFSGKIIRYSRIRESASDDVSRVFESVCGKILWLLPIASFLLIFSLTYQYRPDWRDAFLASATLWAAAAVLITEALSLPSWLTVPGLTAAWILIIAVTAVIRRNLRSRDGGARYQWRSVLEGLSAECWFMVAACGIIASLVAAVALLSAPNTADAMHYHLPRIVHWLQNRNVGHWATANDRQLYLSPGAEYLVLQFHALIGGDTLDNLVQWFSMVASVVGVSLVARELGASRAGQALASLICATIPEGILESSGSKNDYTVTLWIVAIAYYLLSYKREASWRNTVLIGLTLGLSYLTKATAVLFVPWIVVCSFIAYSPKVRKLALKRAVGIAAIALLMNAPPMARNLRARGSISGGSMAGACSYINQPIGIKCTLSNILRNVALHLDTPSKSFNASIESGFKGAFKFLGISPDDPQCTFCTLPFRIPELAAHEALAPNSLGLILLVACIAALLFKLRPWPERSELKLFALSLLLSALSFCVVLSWQPWHTRLHLPLFVLGSALAGTVVSGIWPKYLSIPVAVILIVGAAPFALENAIRPLLFGGNVFDKTREELYFADWGGPELLPNYRQAAAFIKQSGCKDIGLDIDSGGYEYPMLALLDGGYLTYDVRHMPERSLIGRVANDLRGHTPCSVICFSCKNRADAPVKYDGPGTVKTFLGDIVVYGQQPSPSGKPVTLRGAESGWIFGQGISLAIDSVAIRKQPRIALRGKAGFQWPAGVNHDIPLPQVKAYWWGMGAGGGEVRSSIRKSGPDYEIVLDVGPADLPDNRLRSIELRFDRSFTMVGLGLNPDTRPCVLPEPYEITTAKR